jgi:Sec-independent protein translocase protein TatA
MGRMESKFTFLSPLDCIIFAIVVVILFGPRLPGVFEDFQAAARDIRRTIHLPVMRMEGWELVFVWVIVAVLLAMLMCL